MFHGTTSVFASRILSDGLLPYPKKKTWDNGLQRSVGGVYLTPSLERAHLFAKEAVRKHGGQKSIVAVDVEPRSAFADEDDVLRLIRWSVDLSGYKEGQSVSRVIDKFLWLLSQDGFDPHPKLRTRIAEMLPCGLCALMCGADILPFLDEFSRTLKGMVSYEKAMRIPDRVGFHGSNKIVSMIIIDAENKVSPLMALSEMPQTFFFQWRKTFGNLEISNRT